MNPPLCWCLPPDRLSLDQADEVHVWRSLLDLPLEYLDRLEQNLSSDERARADRFRFLKDRNRFVTAHGLLRSILGRYLTDVAPRDLRFCYNAYGKPALSKEFKSSLLRFSMSHSRDLVLYAVTRGREIGIDLEYIRPDTSDEHIAERFFSTHEVAALRELPRQAQPEAFFTCWTRKEAYVKGRGEGLSIPLDQFDVSVKPGEPARLLRVVGDELARWSLCEVWPGCGYVAALAVAGPIGQLRCWQWPVL